MTDLSPYGLLCDCSRCPGLAPWATIRRPNGLQIYSAISNSIQNTGEQIDYKCQVEFIDRTLIAPRRQSLKEEIEALLMKHGGLIADFDW